MAVNIDNIFMKCTQSYQNLIDIRVTLAIIHYKLECHKMCFSFPIIVALFKREFNDEPANKNKSVQS